jgi:hypothetical protein
MGIGIALLAAIILFVISSFLRFLGFPWVLGLVPVIFFVIFGAYLGYILGGKEESIRLLKTGLIAGILLDAAFAFLMSEILIDLNNPNNSASIYLIIFASTIFAVSMFAFPRPKNMLLLAAFCVLGGAIGYGIYLVGENLASYLNNALAANIVIVVILTLFFLLISTGISGASIAVGMYFFEGTPYTKRDIPRSLRIIRVVGIVLAILILLSASYTVVETAKYASTSSVIRIDTGGERITIYAPVLLDENEKVLEMYEKPSLRGDANAAIIETNHGKALKISGSGVFEVSMNQKFGRLSEKESTEFLNRFVLSMSNATHFGEGQSMDAWIYSEGDVNEFNVYLTLDNGRGRIISINQGPMKLAKGWQVISLQGGGVRIE